MTNEQNYIFINYEEAQDLVERIAVRASRFNHTMHENEKEAMAHLLSDAGVKVSDIVNVANLADNYAINAEIVYPADLENYDYNTEDALFSWEEEEGICYCMQW